MLLAMPSVPAGPCQEQEIDQIYSGDDTTDMESEVEDGSSSTENEIDSDAPDHDSEKDEEEMMETMQCGPCRPGLTVLQHKN